MDNVSNPTNLYTPPHGKLCPAVSIIIPMFNAERYIANCLNSILAQTFQNFEVIVVDDCSTDSSCEIVQSYMPKFDGRLKLLHTEENSGGCAVPRNVGLPLSRGEYIFFMDADDLFTKTALEELYVLAKKYDADVVYLDGHFDTDDALQKITPVNYKLAVTEPTLESENLSERLQRMWKGRYTFPTWDKFVQRDLLVENKIFFPHVRPSEDDIWTFGLLFYAKKFLRVPNKVYIRRNSKGSITRKEKTPLQVINFWLNPILLGLKHLDELMRRCEFFKANPQYRYSVLEMFVYWKFNAVFGASINVSSTEFYESLKQEYGSKFGEYDVLIPALCTAVNTQQKINFDNQQKFQQFAKQAKEQSEKFKHFAEQSQEQVKQFNQFAAAAKNRIAELEKYAVQAQARIAQLEEELKNCKTE